MAMQASRHMVRELDLASWNPNSLVDRINAVPGLKTSAAFFTFLRANLVLNDLAVSQASTPVFEPAITSRAPALPSTSLLANIIPSVPPDHEITPLSLELLSTDDDKADALVLIADSVRQQRRRAVVALISHPLCALVLGFVLAVIYRWSWVARGDPLQALTLACVFLATYTTVVLRWTSDYDRIADDLGRWWLKGEFAEEDLVLGTRCGGAIVGAVVLRLVPPSSSGSGNGSTAGAGSSHGAGPGAGGGRRRGRTSSLRGGRGVIRAWTVQKDHRRNGVGADLLAETVRLVRERCGRDAEVGFARAHANSTRVLPWWLAGGWLRQTEKGATAALEKAISGWDGRRRR